MARYIHTLIQRINSWLTSSFGIDANMPKVYANYAPVSCLKQKQVSDHDRYKHRALQKRQYRQV